MTSILTNVSAQTALQTLRNVSSNLQETQQRISTGLEVRSAKDNPAFFLVSQQVRGDQAVLDGLNDNLTLSVNAATTATNGINSINGTLNEIQTTLTTADSGQALEELQFTLDNLVGEIEGTIDATSFNGVNLLAGDGTRTVTTTVTRDGGNFNISTFTLREQNLGDVSTYVDANNAAFTLANAYSAYSPEVFDQIDGASAVGIGSNGALTFTNGSDDDADGAAGGGSFQVTAEAAAAINAAITAFGLSNAALADAELADGAAGADGFFEFDAAEAIIAAEQFDVTLADGTTQTVATLGDLVNVAVVGDAALRTAVAGSGFTGAARAVQVAGGGGNVQAGLVVADALIGRVNLAASTLGTFERTLQARQDFLSDLSDSLEQGVSSLVEADLDEESTRLQALQVQEQLAIQALTIANQQPQNILSLFR